MFPPCSSSILFLPLREFKRTTAVNSRMLLFIFKLVLMALWLGSIDLTQRVSKRRTRVLGFSKHHVFGFIDLRRKVMASSCIWMISHHHSTVSFLHLLCRYTLPIQTPQVTNSSSHNNVAKTTTKHMQTIYPCVRT